MHSFSTHLTRWLFILGAFCTLMVLPIGCSPSLEETNTIPEAVADPFPWSDSLLTAMNLESKIAQMIMVDFPSELQLESEKDRNKLWQHTLQGRSGGVILFAGKPLEYGRWIEWMQSQSVVPQLVGLDAEWGAGYRLQGMTRFPNAMTIAASQQTDLAYSIGKETARQAATIGVSVLFAPVADVLTNPSNPVIGTRSWSDDPDSVAAYASAYARGVRDAGLLEVAKHFPGHGDTATDSHTSLPKSDRTNEQFDGDLKPFSVLIQDSLSAVMTAHIIPSGHSYADDRPSTLSHRIVTELLRDSLRFEGVVFSDALNMAGVTNVGTPAEVAVQSIQAGIDVLLMPPNPEDAFRAIVRAVQDGGITPARIDSSVQKILRAKERLGFATKHVFVDQNASLLAVTEEETGNKAWFAGRNSVTLLRNDGQLPFDQVATPIVLITADHKTYDGTISSPAKKLFNAFQERAFGPVSWVEIDPRDWQTSMLSLTKSMQRDVLVVFADFVGTSSVSGWRRYPFIERLASLGPRVVVADFGSPYVALKTPPSVSGEVLGYDESLGMILAVSDIMFGLSPAVGKLPIHLSDSFPRGFGLSTPSSAVVLASPESVSMSSRQLKKLDRSLDAAVFDHAFSAAALLIGRGSTIVKQANFGEFTYDSGRELQSSDRFDMASLTKVIATTTAIMQLYEADKIDLYRPVADYLPEFGNGGKEQITIWDLLTHTGGLIPFRPFYAQGVTTGKEVRERILNDSLAYSPGSESKYSDFGPITLAWMIERITGESFAEYTQNHIFQPLGMNRTGYNSIRKGAVSNAVPTEKDEYFRFRTLQGEVHDETAYLLGGTAGHAGLFSTAQDLALFASMLVNDGKHGDVQFLKPETIRLFSTKVDPFGDHTRALGWDTKSPTGYSSAGSHFGPRSFGHTGFTGTSLWIDPDSHLFVILLTNRVYPTRDNRGHIPIRPLVADLAFEAITLPNAAPKKATVPSPK